MEIDDNIVKEGEVAEENINANMTHLNPDNITPIWLSKPCIIYLSTPSYYHLRECYFSPDSLIADTTIRSYLDEAGYIPIAFVCNFPEILAIGAYYEDIIAALQNSSLFEVDVENETMRLHDWQKVLLYFSSPPLTSQFVVVAYAKRARWIWSPSLHQTIIWI